MNGGDYLLGLAQAVGLSSEQLINAHPELQNPEAGLSARLLAQILGISLDRLINENPAIGNPDASLGLSGLEFLNIPEATLLSVANKLGIALNDLLKMNPDISDPYSPINSNFAVKIPGDWKDNAAILTKPILEDIKPFDNALEFIDYGEYTSYKVIYNIPKQLAPLFVNNLITVF
ncbi:MAG: hypothetical protein NTW02_00955 [Cyanobium sp. LacPavin_0920_WC12_MAG_62_9]|nr:hypothetical protein [Cyanobium sp. LacPavin_0920_WC12_MAG_62_9]